MTSKKFFDDEDDIIEDIDPASQYEVGENDDLWITNWKNTISEDGLGDRIFENNNRHIINLNRSSITI